MKVATKKVYVHLVSVYGAAGILSIFIKYTSSTDTDKADDFDLLHKLCLSVYSSHLNNSDFKYMCGIVCSISVACAVPFADAHSLV